MTDKKGRRGSIIEEWAEVVTPPPPPVEAVSLSARTTALLILDIQKSNCNPETRPRCVATLPEVRELLREARRLGMLVVYSLTRGAQETDVRDELAPRPEDPIVRSGVDKFHDTPLEGLLCARGIETVILVGTPAHGAVLHTATAAVLRGLKVVVPVDGISASEPFAEQYTAWHLVNAPGTRRQARLTRLDLLKLAL
ncbi:MAG: cysteine hydrolase [Chloroflexi bacterium]|nr:cysteine hydrolase [Chloroflexota bacterium]